MRAITDRIRRRFRHPESEYPNELGWNVRVVIWGMILIAVCAVVWTIGSTY